MSRKIDKAGRICLPKNLRAKTGLIIGSAVDITETEDGGILIMPHSPLCRICGSPEDVIVLQGIGICKKCAYAIINKVIKEK